MITSTLADLQALAPRPLETLARPAHKLPVIIVETVNPVTWDEVLSAVSELQRKLSGVTSPPSSVLSVSGNTVRYRTCRGDPADDHSFEITLVSATMLRFVGIATICFNTDPGIPDYARTSALDTVVDEFVRIVPLTENVPQLSDDQHDYQPQVA